MDGGAWEREGTWMIDHSDVRVCEYVHDIICNLRPHDELEAFAARFDGPDKVGRFALARDFLQMADKIWVFGNGRLPVAALVVCQQWPHRWSVAMMTTERWPLVALSVTKFAKRRMIPELERLGARRIVALSRYDHTVAHRWLCWMGAEHEATLRSFGRDGADYHMFTIFR